MFTCRLDKPLPPPFFFGKQIVFFFFFSKPPSIGVLTTRNFICSVRVLGELRNYSLWKKLAAGYEIKLTFKQLCTDKKQRMYYYY